MHFRTCSRPSERIGARLEPDWWGFAATRPFAAFIENGRKKLILGETPTIRRARLASYLKVREHPFVMVVTASVLAAIEHEIDEPIGEYFDLIAGTSTGGILALGLGFRHRTAETAAECGEIFSIPEKEG
jgi:Patatin-like phospholipase